jgi:hypothetical protein
MSGYVHLKILLFVVFGCLLAGCMNLDPPIASSEPPGIMNFLGEPLQTEPDITEPVLINSADNTFLLNLQAKYDVSARVVSKKKYSWDWNAQLAPYDLALAWGNLNKPDTLPYIRYKQGHRWYYYRYDKNCPYTKQYISQHSANTHVIPATENLKKVLKQIKKNDIIRIEGYLVKINGKVNGRDIWWNSSLTRQDTGNGSCEVLYAKKITHNNKVYE